MTNVSMTTARWLAIVFALTALATGCAPADPTSPQAAQAAQTAPRAITIEEVLAIRDAGPPVWSSDGREIAFAWGVGAERNLWSATAAAPGPAQPGDPSLRQLAPLVDRGGAVLSPDWQSIAYVSKRRIWTVPTSGGRPVRLTEKEARYSALNWSPDSKRVAFLIDINDQTDVGVVAAAGGAVTMIAATKRDEDSPIWSPQSDRIAFIRRFDNWKGYEIWAGPPEASHVRLVVTETYDRGVEEFAFGGVSHWSPDGARIVYLSNRDGYNHLWTVSVDDGKTAQLTKGAFVDYSPVWQPGGGRIAFVGSRAGDLEERHIWVVDAAGGEPVRVSPDGFCASPVWSPDGKRLAYLRSSTIEPPEVVVQDATPGAQVARLTESRPDPSVTASFVEPEAVRYPSADGKSVPAVLLRPRGEPASGGRPALLFFHGKGGINLKGWGGLTSYPFHQYLVQQGYAVLLINWRGTHVGYGNEFEQGNYRDYGGGELQDVVGSAAFLAKEAGVDRRRIACWGTSYGGYMTMLAITKAPELCSAGISLYGVSDWTVFLEQSKRKLWRSRLLAKLGEPDGNRELYDRAAAMRYVAGARAPLLILQGMDDDGVVPAQGEALFDAMRAAGKTVEYVAFVGEGHGFRNSGSQRDLYQRVEAFLGRHNGPRRSETN